MSLKESSTKKIAAAACGVGLLLFGAACSSTISGSATYSGEGKQDTTSSKSDDEDSTTSKDDDEDSTTSDEDETTTSGGGGSISTDPDNPPAQAPDQPYTYDNGITVQLSAPTVDDSLGGLLSSEVGRVVTMTFTNPSDATFDFSNIGYDTSITCPASQLDTDQYILNKSELNSTSPTVAAGQTATFTYEIGIREDAVETECLFEIEIQSEDFNSIDTANFIIVFPAS